MQKETPESVGFAYDGDTFKVSGDAVWITMQSHNGEEYVHVNPFGAWTAQVQSAALAALAARAKP